MKQLRLFYQGNFFSGIKQLKSGKYAWTDKRGIFHGPFSTRQFANKTFMIYLERISDNKPLDMSKGVI